LQLFHIFDQQILLLIVAYDEWADKLLILDILIETAESETFYIVAFQLFLNFLKFSAVIMFVYNIDGVGDCPNGFITLLDISNNLK